jgi:hypothetical protein
VSLRHAGGVRGSGARLLRRVAKAGAVASAEAAFAGVIGAQVHRFERYSYSPKWLIILGLKALFVVYRLMQQRAFSPNENWLSIKSCM